MSTQPWAIVTGASSGIGAELARALAARHFHLILCARRLDRLEALAAELRGGHHVEVEIVALDLALPASVDELLKRALRPGRHVQVLVNNAGIGVYGPASEVPWPQVEEYVHGAAAPLPYIVVCAFGQFPLREKQASPTTRPASIGWVASTPVSRIAVNGAPSSVSVKRIWLPGVRSNGTQRASVSAASVATPTRAAVRRRRRLGWCRLPSAALVSSFMDLSGPRASPIGDRPTRGHSP